ncbi:MAG: DUF4369 domain-containing protein [Hymenobacter sp.]|nr:MAG: DUF4369 domain-containing protein [Hymenobacter sp.]
MHLRLLFPPLLSLLLVLPSQAQQPAPAGYTIEGQDPRLTGRHVYLLTPERPSPTQPWPALDSAQADATGHFTLHGRVPAPDVYWLRLDQQRVLQPVPLANQQERLTGAVELSPSSTRQAPVYLLHLSGSPEVEWLQALQPYGLLRNQAAAGNDKRLRQLQAQLRQQADSYLAPYVAFHYLRLHPSARPLLDSLTTRFAREQPASPYLPRLRELLDKAPTLAIGALAPDFTLADLHGHGHLAVGHQLSQSAFYRCPLASLSFLSRQVRWQVRRGFGKLLAVLVHLVSIKIQLFLLGKFHLLQLLILLF